MLFVSFVAIVISGSGFRATGYRRGGRKTRLQTPAYRQAGRSRGTRMVPGSGLLATGFRLLTPGYRFRCGDAFEARVDIQSPGSEKSD